MSTHVAGVSILPHGTLVSPTPSQLFCHTNPCSLGDNLFYHRFEPKHADDAFAWREFEEDSVMFGLALG
jgi:hypothetical protein